MLLLTNNVGDPQKLIDMKFSNYSYIKMKYFALKINIKMLIEKHVRMFLTSDDFFFQIICQIFCTCVWNNFELVLID